MKRLWITLFSLFLIAPVVASADTLLIDKINQAPPNVTGGMLRPTLGMTMDEVEQQFGAPSNKYAPVGNPPITRWVYPDFAVYFEYQTVLTSVINR